MRVARTSADVGDQHVVDDVHGGVGGLAVTFPGITEAVMAGNFSVAEEWVGKTTRGILVAGDILKT